MSKSKKQNQPKNQKTKRTSGSLPVWVWLAIGVIVLAVGGGLLLQSGGHDAQNTTGALPSEISVAQAVAMRNEGAFILDVRQPEEWQEYHVPGSTLIPLGELEARVNEIPADQEIVVVCRSGNRSTTGRDILRQAGFEQVTSMAGGLIDWRANGYPTVSGP